HAIKRGNRRGLQIALALSWLMGFAFMINQGIEFAELKFGVDDNAYASLFIVISGLHGLHVVVGLLISIIVQIKAARGWFDSERHVTVTVFSLYWHFVDVVWIFVFTTLHLSPHFR
ncbi:MAG: heme-copper oxidase subunit III, partial [Ilumatobacteraceae bacterium]